MFKLLLVALISLIVPFKFVYADVLTSIKDSWDSAKNVLIELSEEEEIKTDLPQERALAIWDELKDNFEEIAELKLNKESAPNESFFGKTKRDYDEKIETIFQILSKITNDPQIVKDRSSLEKLKLKIAKSKQKSSDLKTKALLSTGKDKEKLIDKSNSHLSDIDEYQNSYNEVLSSQ